MAFRVVYSAYNLIVQYLHQSFWAARRVQFGININSWDLMYSSDVRKLQRQGCFAHATHTYDEEDVGIKNVITADVGAEIQCSLKRFGKIIPLPPAPDKSFLLVITLYAT